MHLFLFSISVRSALLHFKKSVECVTRNLEYFGIKLQSSKPSMFGEYYPQKFSDNAHLKNRIGEVRGNSGVNLC
jgi:hypothetical protein